MSVGREASPSSCGAVACRETLRGRSCGSLLGRQSRCQRQGFRISDRIGPFTPSRARSPINAKSLQSQGWECRKRPSGSGKLARSRCNQVGARSVHTPMAGWPAGALVPSSPKVRLGLAHPPAYAHGSPRPPSPAWRLCRDVR